VVFEIREDEDSKMTKMKINGPLRLMAVSVLLLACGACERTDLPVPTEEEVAQRFEATPGVSVEMNGNVAEVTVRQPYEQVRRGGTLWAKVGPYIYLFSDEVHNLFLDYPGLAGVRVITTAGSAGEVARALVARDDLSDVLWRRAKNIAGRARLKGTERPSLLENLILWGEERVDHEYNPRFLR